MGSLAGLLKAAGHDVRGSDEHVYPPMSTQLAELGVAVMEGYRPSNLDWGPETVVVGNVCRKDQVEVVAAEARNIPLESFPSLFGKLFLPGKRSVVVAGTHGKTTTSSLLAHLLAQDGMPLSEADPRFHQQMVYAVGMATIAVFEKALGRTVLWSPRLPRTADGKVLYEHHVEDRAQVISEPALTYMVRMMRGVMTPPGTGARAAR